MIECKLDDRKRAILKTWGVCDFSDVADIDDVASTITFTDGKTRTKTDVYVRVMGYHRPTSAFNNGKRQEHADRKFFKESSIGA